MSIQYLFMPCCNVCSNCHLINKNPYNPQHPIGFDTSVRCGNAPPFLKTDCNSIWIHHHFSEAFSAQLLPHFFSRRNVIHYGSATFFFFLEAHCNKRHNNSQHEQSGIRHSCSAISATPAGDVCQTFIASFLSDNLGVTRHEQKLQKISGFIF